MSGAAVVAEARLWLGTPYLHQASKRGVGCDCLGLLRGVWRGLRGAEPCVVPRYSADWAEAARREVLMAAAEAYLTPLPPEAPPEPGEVLLFRMFDGAIAKHLGFRGRTGAAGSFIHAYSGHGVVESALTPPWARRIVGRYRLI
ncbi:C40 family peptidase [Falsigemmobacter faecalis]|uniref:Peptidase n=1 Tax=Falsigemmobacter faecalis TaxID=2488730 RepID=A0A3P3DUJ3_9RHOB|nr:peptidase [Falsigemmobacter faecalis]RRH77406.1 peptidase [Falsigemmobacter faecalis]